MITQKMHSEKIIQSNRPNSCLRTDRQSFQTKKFIQLLPSKKRSVCSPRIKKSSICSAKNVIGSTEWVSFEPRIEFRQ